MNIEKTRNNLAEKHHGLTRHFTDAEYLAAASKSQDETHDDTGYQAYLRPGFMLWTVVIRHMFSLYQP
jgi:hypothetical protein